MALDGQAMVDPQTAVRIITAAIQTDWDRDFTSNDKIKSWLLEQVQKVPFDPRSVTLLDYVKTRMEAAKVQQKQQTQQQQQQQSQPQSTSSQSQQPSSQTPQPQQYQQQQLQFQQQPQQPHYQPQQQQYLQQQREGSQPNQLSVSHPSQSTSSSSSSYTTSARPASNGSEYTVLSDDDSSEQQSEDDQQYQFDLSDFAEQSKTQTNTVNPSPSVNPLPPPLSYSQSQHATQPSTSGTTIFPYSTGHPQQTLTSAPPSTTTASQQSFYHHQALPVSQPMGLNPALLLNHQARQQQQFQQQLQQPQVISPHQLMQQQQNTFQVNAASLASSRASTSASASPAPVASTSTSTSNGKAKRKTEVEVVVPRRKEGVPSSSASSSAKRKKVTKDAVSDPSNLLSSTVGATKQAADGQTSTSTSSTATPQLQSILSISPNTPQPLSPSQQAWNEIRKEMEKCLQQATRSPHKTVMKMFKLLSPFVSEPADAHSRQGSREAFITVLRLPAEARLTILDIIKDETDDDFDVIFVVDPRATTLLHEWTKDLALIAKGKYNGPIPEEDLKKTSRSLMAVFKKLPISLNVLQTLKGVGADVAILAKSDAFDEVTKDSAKVLVKKWKALIEKANAGVPRSSTPSHIPSAAATSKKRPESTGSNPAASEESRKKRRTSPVPSTDKSSIATSDKLSNATVSSAAKGPGTQPLGRLPTTIKPTMTGKVLPSFAKRKPTATAAPKGAAPTATPKPAPAAAPAASAAFDPFALSLQHMAASKESAAGSGMSVSDTLNMLNKAMDATSAGKVAPSIIPRAGQSKKKSVRWAEEDKLKMIKIVEKLVYGDEFGNEITTSEYFNTTGETAGEHEGVAMKGLVEQMDWEEPQMVDRKFSEETQALVVEYPSPELMEGAICERDIQAEREKTVLATTFLSEDDIPDSPAEPTAETSAPSIPTITEPVIMRLSHDLANDQAVQLSILQAQTARSFASTSAEGSQHIVGMQGAQSGPSYSTGPQTVMYGNSNAQNAPPPPAVAGADLSSLLAQLSGSGLAATLNTAPAPAMPTHMQHHQPPQHQYPHMQQYSQPYRPRY